MPRKASPFVRVTTVCDYLCADWKQWWYKAVNNALLETLPQDCVEFGQRKRTAEEWKAFLETRTVVAETERVGKESAKFGRNVHAIAENHLLGSPLPEALTEREKFCGGLLVKWCGETKVKPLILGGKTAVECELKDEELGLAGHPDLPCMFGEDARPWLVDWKTSKECRRSYLLQLAAYAGLIRKQYGVSINDGVIVRTPSDPTVMPQFETHTVHGLLDIYWPVFLAGLNVYRYYEKKGKWAIKKAA